MVWMQTNFLGGSPVSQEAPGGSYHFYYRCLWFCPIFICIYTYIMISWYQINLYFSLTYNYCIKLNCQSICRIIKLFSSQYVCAPQMHKWAPNYLTVALLLWSYEHPWSLTRGGEGSSFVPVRDMLLDIWSRLIWVHWHFYWHTRSFTIKYLKYFSYKLLS